MHFPCIIFFLFINVFITNYSCQTLIAQTGQQLVFFQNSNKQFSFNTSIVTPTLCKFDSNVTNTNNYCDAQFTILSNNVVRLSSTTIGRARKYSCNSTNLTVMRGSIIIRPDILAFACESNVAVRTVNSISATANFRFTYPLIEAGSLACNSSNGSPISSTLLRIGEFSRTITFSFNQTSSGSTIEIVTCRFAAGTSSNNVVLNFTVVAAALSFTQNSIVTDKTNFALNLVSNFQISQALQINCYVVTNIDNATCTNTSLNIPMINWTISSPFEIPIDSAPSYTATVNLQRLSRAAGIQQQFASLCCSQTGGYSALARITVNNPSIDNDVTGTSGTAYIDLRYFQLSNCPCDLVVNSCDTNCCCDPFCDCTNVTTARISGGYGGFFNESSIKSCSYPDKTAVRALHSLLCVEYDSGSVIGNYYNWTDIARDINAINILRARSSVLSGLFNTVQNSVGQSNASTSVTTAAYQSGVLPSVYLTLPRMVSGSTRCNPSAIITNFQGYSSQCPASLLACSSSDFLFDPKYYLSSSTAMAGICPNSLFISAIDKTVFAFYRCENETTSCNSDNGFVIPQLSLIDSLCSNVVKSVEYKMYMNGSTVVYIEANILLLANITLGSNINQQFTVSFIPTSMSSPVDVFPLIVDPITAAYLAASAPNTASNNQHKSGLFGYNQDKPIITVQNNTLGVNATWNQIKLPISDANGLCTNSMIDLKFPRDSFISCKYNLNLRDIFQVNCSSLRQQIKQFFDTFLPYQYVAVYGNPQTNADFIKIFDGYPIINESQLIYSTNQTIPLNEIKNICLNISNGMVVQFIYSRQGKVRDNFINNIRGVKKTYTFTDLILYQPNVVNVKQIDLQFSFEFKREPSGLSGNQNTDDVTQTVCMFDVCIDELLYPWMFSYQGQSMLYNHAFGVALLGLAVFIMATSTPFW